MKNFLNVANDKELGIIADYQRKKNKERPQFHLSTLAADELVKLFKLTPDEPP